MVDNSLLSQVVKGLQDGSFTECSSGSHSKRSKSSFSCESSELKSDPMDSSTHDTLYGFDPQLNLLTESYKRMITNNSSELVLIHGPSGSGKSSLVKSFIRTVSSNVLHVHGKFDQLRSHAPYAALVSASEQLCRQILRQQNFRDIRDRVRLLLGPEVNLLGSLVPLLVEITRDTSDIDVKLEGRGGSSSTRFNLLFRSFLRSVASPENPLIFFLDDLQWADVASLEVLKAILTDSLAQNLMVICAYREGGMSKDILQEFQLVDRLNDDDGSISSSNSLPSFRPHYTSIFLDDLNLVPLNELISSRLKTSLNIAKSLTLIIWKKTRGNPYYALNFLDMLLEKGYLSRTHNGHLLWNESQILQMTDVTDNLAKILEYRLKCLPDKVRSILQIASFIGNKFPVSALVKIVYEEQDMIEANYSFNREPEVIIRKHILSALDVARESGLLEKINDDDSLKFAHDKIQEILYEALMPDLMERQLLHQRIGTLIWDSIKDKKKSLIDDTLIFLAADNLNRAADLVDYSGNRYYVVELNVLAAKRAADKAAFLMAAEYLRFAVNLTVADECWNLRYAMCLDLYNAAAETEKNIGCFEQSNILVKIIHKQAKEFLHRSTAFGIEMDSRTLQGNVKGSIAFGLDVLKQLGLSFPRHINNLFVLKELLSARAVLGRRSLHDLLILPEMKSEIVLFSMSIMNSIATNAFILGDSYKETYAAMSLRMFRLTLKHGISKQYSSFAIINWGAIHAVLGQFDVAMKSEKLSMDIIEKFSLDSVRGAALIRNYSVNHFWRKELNSASRNEFLHGYRLAMSYGDINIAHYGFVGWVVAAMYLDDHLTDLHHMTRPVVHEMHEFKARNGLMFLLPTWQALLNITGDPHNENPSRLRGEAFDDGFAFAVREIDSKMALLNVHIMESIVAYTFEDYEFVKNSLCYISKNEFEMKGYFSYGFFQTWLATFHYDFFWCTGNRKHRKLARKAHQNVRQWVATGTEMLKGPNSFLDAMESLGSKRSLAELEIAFQHAAIVCAASRCRFFEALAYERLGRLFLASQSNGRGHLSFFQRAVELYRRWGAHAKANHLERILV